MEEAEYKDNEKVTKRAKRIEKLKLALVLFFLVLVLTSVLGLFEFLTGGSSWEILRACLFGVVISSLVILSLRYKWIGKAANAFFKKYIVFCLWVFATLVPVTFFLWLSRALIDIHLALQVFLLFLWSTLLGAALWLIATSRNRERLFRLLERVGALAPFVYWFNTFFISVIFFGTVSYLFAGPGRLEFTNLVGETLSRNNLSVDDLLGFFMWHFLDAIPFLKINATLNWKIQLTYQSGFVGLIVLLFKIVVIIPVITAFSGYYKYRQLKRDRTDKSDKVIGP
jgi:hypothetical protein